jgi:hypothetical protein
VDVCRPPPYWLQRCSSPHGTAEGARGRRRKRWDECDAEGRGRKRKNEIEVESESGIETEECGEEGNGIESEIYHASDRL